MLNLTLEPVHVILLEKKLFLDVMKLKWGNTRIGWTLHPIWLMSLYEKREIWAQSQRPRKNAIMPPQPRLTKACWQPQGQERGWSKFFHQDSREVGPTLPTPSFQSFELLNNERVNISYSKAPYWWYFVTAALGSNTNGLILVSSITKIALSVTPC